LQKTGDNQRRNTLFGNGSRAHKHTQASRGSSSKQINEKRRQFNGKKSKKKEVARENCAKLSCAKPTRTGYVGEEQTCLPPHTHTKPRGLTHCIHGEQNQLSLVVHKGGKQLLATTAYLSRHKPRRDNLQSYTYKVIKLTLPFLLADFFTFVHFKNVAIFKQSVD
jgi:hypothetical protein